MILVDGIRAGRKQLAAGAEASWLWVCAIDYSRSQLLDGFLPVDALITLGRFKAKPSALAERLCEVGLFERAEGGYQIHDFLDHNHSAEVVREKRSRDAKRKRDAAGLRLDSTRNPNGEKDAHAGARERVGFGKGVGGPVTALEEHDSSPRETPTADPLGPSVWDIWRETGEAHGYPQTLTPRGGNLHANVATIRGLVHDDNELRAALAAWWPSPAVRPDSRSLGHFAGHLPSVLKHVRAGGAGPWGAPAAAGPVLSDAQCAQLERVVSEWPEVVRVVTGVPGRPVQPRERVAAAELCTRYDLDRIWRMAKVMLRSEQYAGKVRNLNLLAALAPEIDAWLLERGE